MSFWDTTVKHGLIIFDCDGVLIDSEYLANQIEVEALNFLGYSVTMEDYLDIALGRTNDEVEIWLQNNYQIELPDDFWKIVCQRQKKEFEARLTPIVGIIKLIQSLKIPYCVASNSDVERLELTLSVAGLYPFLKGRIFGRECVEKGKPEPDIFLYAAEQMGIPASKCLVIEDSMHGIQAAKAAGMEVWAFCGGRHFTSARRKQLEQSGVTHIFDDMNTLLEKMSL